VSPLHVVFLVKGVFMGKEYYSITPPKLCGLMLSKRIVLRSSLEEFLRRCIEQFMMYF